MALSRIISEIKQYWLKMAIFFIPSAFDVRGPHRNIAMFDMEQEAQLSQRHRAMPRVVEYFG